MQDTETKLTQHNRRSKGKNRKKSLTIVFAIDECQVCFTRRGAFVNCSQCSSIKGIISCTMITNQNSNHCIHKFINVLVEQWLKNQPSNFISNLLYYCIILKLQYRGIHTVKWKLLTVCLSLLQSFLPPDASGCICAMHILTLK